MLGRNILHIYISSFLILTPIWLHSLSQYLVFTCDMRMFTERTTKWETYKKRHVNLSVKSTTGQVSTFKGVFGSFLFASYCAGVRSLKTQGFESHRRLFLIFISLSKKINWIVVKHDEINIIKDFYHCLLNNANSLDVGDFRKIISYSGISYWM